MVQTMQPITRHLSIIAVDPGINLGVASLHYNYETKEVIVNDATTFVLAQYIDAFLSEVEQSRGIEVARTLAVEQILYQYCDNYLPDILVHETAFSSHGRVRFGNAVESFARLRENILAIKLAAYNFDTNLQVFTVNPVTVKYTVVGKKGNDKDDISSNLVKLSDLKIDCKTDHLDQHGWDAIAIGYTFIKKHVKGV